jgi:indolepyruvate ferredoxin oxidoreductase
MPADGHTPTSVSLDDKYTIAQGRILLNGIQALVRLPLLQRQRDAAAGLSTAGFISGYRGSPLGGLDQALWKARKHLDAHNVVFKPGINEDLAATAVWGSQQLQLSPGAKFQGAFAMWYGKGPGVDRSVDVIKHANAAGSSIFGGVLAVAGDDHACKSSTFPHQSEQALLSALVPVLHASSVQDVLDYGLYGWAMSRFSGCWAGLKLVSDVADATAVVNVSPTRPAIVMPSDFVLPPGGLGLRWPDPPVEQEKRLIDYKLPAAMAFVRANKLDHAALLSSQPRFGIVTTGKAYNDVRQALDELGLGKAECDKLGLSVYKVAMPWPLEPEGIKAFAAQHSVLLVAEEKRALVESQLKDILYSVPADKRPAILGKRDLSGAPLLPESGELSVIRLALIIGQQLQTLGAPDYLAARLEQLKQLEPEKIADLIERKPHYCSGCPHNTSTIVPEGSRVLGGIGCHYMALWMERKTETFSQMGGEGVAWVGTAPFTEEKHIFANLGDGTYFHSGLMAIRAAVAGGVNITYKILFNDAVAMTGGQPVDGPLSVPLISQQLYAEGLRKIVVVTDEPAKYGKSAGFAPDVEIEHRDELEKVQRALRDVTGVSAIIYDQTCAAEKRRRRKRGKYPDPAKRVVINELVCEGCGDCSVKSNCLSVVPLETEFGRKRTIDQSSCNKDFSCVKGFCPSFVTIEGGELRKPAPLGTSSLPAAPNAQLPGLAKPWSLLITGIGGTGIVTVGAILAMAAHLEGKAATVLDQTGLAQKGGAVLSHVRIAATPEELHAVRLPTGGADAILAGDVVVSASREGLGYTNPTRTRAIINTHETIVANFTRDANSKVPTANLVQRIATRLQPGGAIAVDATTLATAIFGDSIATNLFLLGCAYQQGLVPVGAKAIEQAIELNGAQVAMNISAFNTGRSAMAHPQAVQTLAKPPVPQAGHLKLSADLDEMINRRISFLTDYQNKAYAERYARLVLEVRRAEHDRTPGLTGLTEAVARYLFKLMAYKDEYEVARLHTEGTFLNRIQGQFTGAYKLRLHLAPPLLAKRDAITGEPRKITFGPWILPALKLLAKLKSLRGTPLDVFGYTAERKTERQLIEDYDVILREILANLGPSNHALAVKLAAIPEQIRGYGPVKERHLKLAKAEEAKLLEKFRANQAPSPQNIRA